MDLLIVVSCFLINGETFPSRYSNSTVVTLSSPLNPFASSFWVYQKEYTKHVCWSHLDIYLWIMNIYFLLWIMPDNYDLYGLYRYDYEMFLWGLFCLRLLLFMNQCYWLIFYWYGNEMKSPDVPEGDVFYMGVTLWLGRWLQVIELERQGKHFSTTTHTLYESTE